MPLNFPIIQAATAIAPVIHAVLSDTSTATLPLLLNKTGLVASSYAEWPLLFTTLRVLFSSLAS